MLLVQVCAWISHFSTGQHVDRSEQAIVSAPLPIIATRQNLQLPVGLAWTSSLHITNNGEVAQSLLQSHFPAPVRLCTRREPNRFWPAVLSSGQDRHPQPMTLYAMLPFQRRRPPLSPNTEPHTMAMELC